MIKSHIITPQDKYAGIYAIINLYNNKFYVGSTNNLAFRQRNHFNQLKRNYHDNPHLQRSYNKYGSSYFIMVLLEKVEDDLSLIEREQFWFDELDIGNPNISYNMLMIAGRTTGRITSEETKQKQSNWHMGKVISEESKKKMSKSKSKAIVQCTLDGNFIQEWESGNFASKESDFIQVGISWCCLHKYKQHKGFLWFFKDEYFSENFNITDYIIPEFKPIQQYTLDGELVRQFNSFDQIRKEFYIGSNIKANTTHILRCCEGKKLTTYGYIWKFKEI